MDVTSLLGSMSAGNANGISGAFAANSGEATNDGNGPLMGVGKSDFLKLLVAQLRNQDPMKPMEDKEFIGQMAQLNTVEQVTAMNAKLGEILAFEATTQAASLLGKAVEANTPNGGTLSGNVQEIRFEQGTPLLIVDGQKVALPNVRRISVSV